MINNENISDSEIRVIGVERSSARGKSPWRRWLAVAVAVVSLACVALGVVLWLGRRTVVEAEGGVSAFEQRQPVVQSHPLREWIAGLDSLKVVGTLTRDLTVNDIPLRVYAPLNSTPHLEVGYGVADHRERAILFFQAADVRADNGGIVGAFVLRGEPLSRGLSKRGYCAIIGDKVTVGVADNSPLFEQATEQNGYFFRQYPLVDNGLLVENELKNKSVRRGLCELEGRVVVVESQTPESLHDFAQALVDIGVSNAIYLVGSSAVGWCMDPDGNGTKMGLWDERVYKNISFIVWPQNPENR